MQDKNKTVDLIFRYMSDEEKEESYDFLSDINNKNAMSFDDLSIVYKLFKDKV